MEFEREMLIVFFVILLVWLLVSSRKEGFDKTGRIFEPVGAPQYGLRGDLLRTESIATKYLKANPEERIHHTNGEMYPSNRTPQDEGIEGCVESPCPCTADNYYNGSRCWKCSGMDYVKQVIPPIHPHVMN